MKIDRRSFLKVFGGLAAVATLPSSTLTSLPIIPVQTTTAPTVAAQGLAKRIDEIVKPVGTVVRTVEATLPYTRFSELGHRSVNIRYIDPVVYINGNRLPAHRMTCRLEHYIHSRWLEYNPECELTIDGQVYGDAAKSSFFDDRWQTPLSIEIYLSNGLVYKGKGGLGEYYDTLGSSDERIYQMTIPMWDVVVAQDTEDRWIVN